MVKIYLCGGINGLSDGDCNGWRELAKALLVSETIDPMRRDYRGMEDMNAGEIVLGDLRDIEGADLILVNAIRPSWGTAMEIVYAHLQGKRVVCVASPPVSPWLRYHAT